MSDMIDAMQNSDALQDANGLQLDQRQQARSWQEDGR